MSTEQRSKYDIDTPAETIVADLAPHIADKVILITGVSPGSIGAFYVDQLARAPKAPKLLILAGRNQAKLQATAATAGNVPTRLLTLDLESIGGARAAAATVNSWADVPHIDVLVNNAGIMAVPFAKTVDGIERHFAVNHVAPFVFANLIMPKILKAPGGGRVVSVSSEGHANQWIRWGDINFQDGRVYDKWRGYAQSKTANILFAVALAQKLGSRGLTAVSVHPGGYRTNLMDHLDFGKGGALADFVRLCQEIGSPRSYTPLPGFKSASCFVATHIYASFDPSLKDHNGSYLQDAHISDPFTDLVMCHATDKVEAEKLWRLSEELVGQKFSY